MSPSLFLIDVSAVAYRSYFAFIKNPLVNSRGEETSAIFGFASHTLRLIAECRPSHIAFVKDLPGPTFRRELFAEYKAHRKPMPEPLVSQLPAIDDFVAHSGLQTICLEGYEADDVIGTLALQARAQGLKVYIVSRDKDLMQLVGDSIHLYELGRMNQPSVALGPDGVKEKMGVGPEHIIDLLALMGDASDNIPGVSKVGPKTAQTLLETYGSLAGIYENIDKIDKKALKENLIKDREMAFLSQKLATLDCNLLLPLGISDLRFHSLDVASIRKFLDRWELTSLMKFIPNENSSTDVGNAGGGDGAGIGDGAGEGSDTMIKEKPAGDYRLVATLPELSQLAETLQSHPVLAVDTETSGLNSRKASLVGLCLSVAEGAGWYLPIGHEVGTNLPLNAVIEALSPLLKHPDKQLVFHNAKFDLEILQNHGLLGREDFDGRRIHDTMIAAYLCDPGTRKISLDELALDKFGVEMIPIEELIGKGKNQISFSRVPVDQAAIYGAEDADFTFRLWKIYGEELREKRLDRLYEEMEMALVPVLMEMERRGIRLDIDALQEISTKLKLEIARLEDTIFSLAGSVFNINSPMQLAEILFVRMGLKTGKKTKTGFSTDAAVLQKLEGEHPIISLLLDHRECTKLQNTYVEALPLMADPATQRVHTNYSQVIAATGRLSSLNPNLQNIPIRTELGRSVRKCFTAKSPEYRLLSADYSQIELRLLAHLSGDPALLEAYRKGLDIHARTAAALYGVDENSVTSEMRRNAKVVNFGVLYGMGAHRLAAQLKISRSDAALFISNYFSTYSHVERYLQDMVDKGRKDGYVETLAGRKRYLPDLLTDNRMLKENAERIAANTPIQGSAADLIKIAMIRIHRRLADAKLDCDMLLQVHDELVFEVREEHIEAASKLIREEMEGAMQLAVPLQVDIGFGTNWLEAH